MSWYFLEVERCQEENLMNLLNRSGFQTFVPKKEIYFKKKEVVFFSLKLLFPGTVIANSELSAVEFERVMNSWMILHKQCTKNICKETKNYFQLSAVEKYELKKLMNDDYVIAFSKGAIQNRILNVYQGPLKGHEKEIQKIKRHQRLATLPIRCCGQSIPLILGLEITEKN